MRIPAVHDYVWYYIKLLGLETRPFNNEEQYWHTGDKVANLVNEPGEPELNDYIQKIYPEFKAHLRGDEQFAHDRPTCNGDIAGPGGLIGKYLAGWIGELVEAAREENDEQAIKIGTALLAGDFTGFEEFDKVDTREQMVNAGASPAAIDLVARVSAFQMIFSWSYLSFIRDELIEPGDFSEIKGGMDTLPTALYKRLESKHPGVVQLKQEITCIDAKNKLVVVKDGAGQERKEHYDKLLVTIPFPVLKKMELRGFSDEKMHAIQNFGLGSSTKDLVAYEKRFWEEEGIFSGRSKSDAPTPDVLHMRECYYPADRLGEVDDDPACGKDATMNIFWGGFGKRYKGAAKKLPPVPGTLLASYQFNEGAKFLGCINKKERMDTVLDVIQTIHPNADVKNFVHYEAWTWDDFKWSQGAFAILGKEKLTKYFAAAKKSEHDVFFAGEHVSIAPGWMLGALEAGLRETLAILKSCH